MNLFFTRNDKFYYYLIKSIKYDLSGKTDKEINTFYLRQSAFGLNSFVFVIKNIFNLKVFKNEDVYEIRYKNIHVGKFALAKCLRNPKSYKSKLLKLIYLINYLFKSINLANSSFDKVNSSDAIYIDHPMYLNGIVYSVFSKYNKIIYSNNSPKGFFKIDYSKNKNKDKNDINDALRFSKKLNFKYDRLSFKKIKNFFTRPSNIPWLKNTKFKKITLNKDFNNVDYIVYAHSFLDGVIFYGNDGFLDLRDWLDFTISELVARNAKVIIKGHPNFYNNIFGEVSKVDKEIFENFILKYKKYKNLIFFNEAIDNHQFLKNFSNKKTIIISHHGTITMEAGIAGFKTICSKSTFWDNTFKVSNQWDNKLKYKNLLLKKWDKLKEPNLKDLITLCSQALAKKNDFGEKLWTELIKKKIKKNRLRKNFEIYIIKKIQAESINELNFS